MTKVIQPASSINRAFLCTDQSQHALLFFFFLPIMEIPYLRDEWTRWGILLVHLPFPDKTDVNNSVVSPGVWKFLRFSPGGHDTNTSGALRSSCLIILPMLFTCFLTGFQVLDQGAFLFNSLFLLELSVITGWVKHSYEFTICKNFFIDIFLELSKWCFS